ncbi:Adhesion and hyphal regulator 1 [Cytospora mali]|uniref:Adhesion and hyphal regulator 1 n=1 Tax=Cytospora mali TaxID=578113 RepID=A0A194VH98_CYTMA|nr:Adhesion and hyphal regulator 1 [Valsa mali]
MHDHFEMPPNKRQRVSDAGISRRPSKSAVQSTTASPGKQRPVEGPTPPSFPRGREPSTGYERAESRRESESMDLGRPATSPAVAKPKRVRTGCLTCRNRHLKCDEAMPICLNCQKSNRKCERGVRLNFIDLKVEQPPVLLPPVDWKVQFQDESRLIASEYVGGSARYAKLDRKPVTPPTEHVGAEPTQRRKEIPVRPAPGHFLESSRTIPLASTQTMYYPGALSRPTQEQTYAAYEDHITQTDSRKCGDAFLAMGSGPTPASSHSGHGGRPASFSLGTMHDPYGMRDETVQMIQGYRSSDVSSVASSLVPQGVAASSSGSYRHATGSGPADPHDGLMTPQSEKNGERDYLNTPEEIHYMQVFIDKVAVWMDSLDNQKHFGRVIPYLALKSPMLLNAFLACGVKHLTLVDGGIYKDDKALHYYDTATTQLLRNLQNPERNTAECATTAVVLNVYEIMSERPAARIHHIAGARALIRECKWNAKSTGIGAACFWLNVSMEILSCLASNWATAWDPDHWGVDPEELMNMTADSPGREGRMSSNNDCHHMIGGGAEDFPSPTSNVVGVGEEETWVHRILYITAKVANFRATIPQSQEASPHDEQVRLQSRFAEWQRLKNWCDTWNATCPRSMRPYGYLFSSSTNSVFPNVWLIKRAAIVGRLFYHTAMCLLAQINPLKHPHHDDDETRTIQLHHAHQVCGIVAHTKDQGVSTVAIRSVAVVGCVLTDHREQDEVLAILNRIYRSTGWNLKKVVGELRKAWGWDPPDSATAGSAAPGAGAGAGATLPVPPSAPPPMAPMTQGDTIGSGSGAVAAAAAAAVVMNQHFGGQRDPTMQQPQDTRRPSQAHPPPPPPPPQPLLASQASTSSFSSTTERHRQASLASNAGGAQTLSGFTSTMTGPRQNTSITASSSNHPSPAGTVHTPGSVSSTVANAATPPSRPMGVV